MCFNHVIEYQSHAIQIIQPNDQMLYPQTVVTFDLGIQQRHTVTEEQCTDTDGCNYTAFIIFYITELLIKL